jgi:hypothetical protein
MKLSCLIPFSVLKEKGTWNSHSLGKSQSRKLLSVWRQLQAIPRSAVIVCRVLYIQPHLNWRHWVAREGGVETTPWWIWNLYCSQTEDRYTNRGEFGNISHGNVTSRDFRRLSPLRTADMPNRIHRRIYIFKIMAFKICTRDICQTFFWICGYIRAVPIEGRIQCHSRRTRDLTELAVLGLCTGVVDDTPCCFLRLACEFVPCSSFSGCMLYVVSIIKERLSLFYWADCRRLPLQLAA